MLERSFQCANNLSAGCDQIDRDRPVRENALQNFAGSRIVVCYKYPKLLDMRLRLFDN
ncbi:hypothetical protein D9M69_611970 [compost metagenome]